MFIFQLFVVFIVSESISGSVVPTLCDSVDFSLSGSSAHGILQARILEWVAIPFPRQGFSSLGSNPGLIPGSG